MKNTTIILIYNAFESGITALLCFAVGYSMSILIRDQQTTLDSLWCMLSGLVVLQWLTKDAIAKAKELVIGSIIGCIVSTLICYLIGYQYLAIFFSVTLSMLVTGIIRYQKGIITASVTAAGVTGFGMLQHITSPQFNALMRATDTIIGVILAISIVFLSSQLKIR